MWWFIRIAALALPLIAGSVSLAGFAIFEVGAQSAASFTPAWQTLKMGAGGLINNVQVSLSDGTKVTSANTGGAYLRRTTGTCAGADNGGWGTTYAAPCWEQVFTQTSSPQTLTQVTQLSFGVLEIDSCNNNTNDAYAITQGALYVTSNLKAASSSRSWTKFGTFTQSNANQNIAAGTGRDIACDPANPNIVYASNLTALYATSTGLSATGLAPVSGVGTTGTLPSAIAFDPTSATQACSQFTGSPTCTKHFWVFTQGTGVYETYNGGSSFTLTSGGPTAGTVGGCGGGGSCFSLREDKFGNVWAAIGDTHIYKYVPNGSAGGGTWSTVTPAIQGTAVAYFALDPTSAAIGSLRIAATGPYGNISVSTNGGSTWSTATNQPFTASGAEPPWIGNANQDQGNLGVFYDTQELVFDESGNLWMGAGIGTYQIASASVAAGATWQSAMLGIEELVVNHIDTPPGSSPIVAVWDRGFFLLQNPDIFPTHYYPDESFDPSLAAVNAGWALDWASANPATLTGWAGTQTAGGVAASSSDGGNTWTRWGNTPSPNNFGGSVAASSATNWITVPGENQSNLSYTTNGASTAWLTPTITGQGNLAAQMQVGFSLAADRVTAGAFCAYDSNGAIFSSTNSGATWTKRINAGATNTGFYNHALKAVPGNAGTFYLSGGNQGGGSTNLQMYKITKTTNECDTATLVNANFTNIFGMGFGAPQPGGNGFPTIYFYGWNNSVLGLWEIDNGGTTASLINVPSSAQTWPNNSLDFVQDVSGDYNVYGRVYVAHAGSGPTYIDKQDACPWVNFSNVKVTQNLTGTVTLSAQHSGLVPVTSVSFYVDGSLIGTQTTGSGTPTTYSQSWVTGGVAHGAHTLTVSAIGNGCNTPNQTYNSFTIPITTSLLMAHDLDPANDNTPMWLERVG